MIFLFGSMGPGNMDRGLCIDSITARMIHDQGQSTITFEETGGNGK
jgi:hypothetical protein